MHIEYDGSTSPPVSAEILHDFGFFGHYLHMHAGGRGGKQFVLVSLDKSDGHLTQRELLEQSKISSAALSEVLAKLEGEGLLTRTACVQDRRQLNIELTASGRTRAKEIRSEREQFEHEALSCLTQEEQLTLGRLLDRLVAHWKSLGTEEVSA